MRFAVHGSGRGRASIPRTTVSSGVSVTPKVRAVPAISTGESNISKLMQKMPEVGAGLGFGGIRPEQKSEVTAGWGAARWRAR
jgi:hypothetical protein